MLQLLKSSTTEPEQFFFVSTHVKDCSLAAEKYPGQSKTFRLIFQVQYSNSEWKKKFIFQEVACIFGGCGCPIASYGTGLLCHITQSIPLFIQPHTKSCFGRFADISVQNLSQLRLQKKRLCSRESRNLTSRAKLCISKNIRLGLYSGRHVNYRRVLQG